jgi:membrane protein YqaA with SNARE-associated domain
MNGITNPSEKDNPPSARPWLRPLLIGLVLVAVNIAIYFALPTDLVERIGNFGYLGAFLSALLANASVVIPVPYYPLLIRLGQAFDPIWITLLAAAGSTIGELTAFYVGRSGKGAVENTRFYRWTQEQLNHRWRAPLVLFGLSAIPNPAFDVAGLLAGAMGIPVWLFMATVFPGRIIRMGTVIAFGLLL